MGSPTHFILGPTSLLASKMSDVSQESDMHVPRQNAQGSTSPMEFLVWTGVIVVPANVTHWFKEVEKPVTYCWGEGVVAWRWEEWRQESVVEILRRTKGSPGL